jgi:hypothetical protein
MFYFTIIRFFFISLFACLLSATSFAQTVLFQFSTPFTDSAASWNVYTDQVMGGNSTADISISDSSSARFSGVLSFANKGGIAQVISPYIADTLSKYEGIALRFRGDGTSFTISLQNATVSCAAKHLEYTLHTTLGEWVEVQIPFTQFRNTYFGVAMLKHPLSLNDVHHISLVNIYQEGNFWLDLDWIKLF